MITVFYYFYTLCVSFVKMIANVCVQLEFESTVCVFRCSERWLDYCNAQHYVRISLGNDTTATSNTADMQRHRQYAGIT